VEKIW